MPYEPQYGVFELEIDMEIAAPPKTPPLHNSALTTALPSAPQANRTVKRVQPGDTLGNLAFHPIYAQANSAP
jgi:hypothetical protein